MFITDVLKNRKKKKAEFSLFTFHIFCYLSPKELPNGTLNFQFSLTQHSIASFTDNTLQIGFSDSGI